MDHTYFDKYLPILLFAIIEKLSLAENDLIHQTALATIHYIAVTNEYHSFDALIVNNSDYIIDQISHELNYSISLSYFSHNQIYDNFHVFNSRIPQILQSLLSHTKSVSVILPLLYDTIEHILNSLDSLSRNTKSEIKHNTPIINKICMNGNASQSMFKSPLVLAQNNTNLQNDIQRKLIINEQRTNNATDTRQIKLSSDDIIFIKNKMKQKWQIKCIQKYMNTLFCIVNTVQQKNILFPKFLNNEESKNFDHYLSYKDSIDYNINDENDYLCKELQKYSNLLDGNMNDFSQEKLDLNDWKKSENILDETKEEKTENDPFYRKRPNEPSKEQSIIENIMKRCVHFISSNVMEIKYLSLCIVEKCVFILSFRKKILLPIIATFWQSFPQIQMEAKATDFRSTDFFTGNNNM